MEEQQEEMQSQMSWQAVKTAASALAMEEVGNLLLHVITGNYSGMAEGVIFGGIAALAAGYNAPRWLRYLRDTIPQEELEPLLLLTHREPGKRSIMDKLLDRHPSDRHPDGEAEEEWEEEWYEDNDDFEGSHLDDDGPFTLSQLLATGWRPSAKQIFLARLEDGTDVFVSVEDLVHIALAGSTRQGKTSIIRQLLAQLCSIGACCILMDPHYTPYDVEIDEDWTPFTPHLRFDPLECKSFERIEKILRYAATSMLDQRKKLREEMKPVGTPVFMVIDEYPAVVAEKPVVQKYVAKLLREGAKYKIHLCVASQDFQVKTISPEAGGAIRDNYKTCFYVGGDKTTANVLLNSPVDPDVDAELGKGPVMLRCAIVKKGKLAYTAFTDNEGLYQLLGPSTYHPNLEEKASGESALDGLGIIGQDAMSEEARSTSSSEPLPEVVKRDTRRKAEEIDLKVAIALWNAGFNSRARLAKALDIAENQAGKLMGLMESQGTDGRTDG